MIEAKESLIEQTIGLAIEVHRSLGPGLLESVCELSLSSEFGRAGIEFERQREVAVDY